MGVRRHAQGGLAWRLSALALVVAVATAVSYLAFGFAPRERARAIDRWHAQLSAMADDRQSAIDSWLGEKLAAARTLAGYPTVLRLVGTAGAVPASRRGGQELRAHLGDVLGPLVRNGGYRGAALLDAKGRLLTAVGPEPEFRADCLGLSRRALGARRPLAELHLHAGARPLIQLVAPIEAEAGAAPVGVVVLTVDPEDWLYPFLRHQPLASSTEETLLLGRDGDSVLFLSPLRHRPDPPLTLRVPMVTPRLVATAALGGVRQFGGYVDYRGQEVLAATRQLASAPWAIVAKVDQTEALGGVRENVTLAAIALFGLCAALGGSFLGASLALAGRARARLAHAEARFALLLDQASDAIFVVDGDGRIRDANQRALEMYGYSREQLRELHVSALRRDKARDEVERLAVALQQRGSLLWEAVHVSRDDRELPVEVAARVVELDGERLNVSIIRDISERKRADEALRASEARFRSLFESMLNGFAHCRMLFEDGVPVDFVYLDVNDAFGKLTGLKNVVGRRVSEVIPGIRATNPELFQIYGRVASGGAPERFETYVPVLAIWFSISVYRPQPGHFVAVFDNVSERRQAEDEIRCLNTDLERRVAERTSELARLNQELQSEVEGRARVQLAVERYAREVEDLYNHAPCGYHSLDTDGRIVTINDTELEWLGYAREELLGRSVQELLSARSRETFAASYPVFKERGIVSDVELELVRKDGSSFWVLVNATSIRDEKGSILRSRTTMFDITELVHTRQQVAERTAALEAANRELEAFSYSVSHDLRAPLRAIAGFSSLLASDHSEKLDAEARGLLDRVCDNTRRMSQLIDDLLAFSGVGRKEMNPGRLSMNGLVAACVAELTAGLDPSRLEIEVGTLPDAFGDASMLRQVWTNLLSNALKFTGPRPRARILVRGCSEKGERVYSVEDNGVGFDERYAGKLFGVFQRLHSQREFPGTGVGLALVQRVVERHGGRVWAASRQGEGATFCFALPAPTPEGSASD